MVTNSDNLGEPTTVKLVVVAKDFLTIAIFLVVIVFLWVGYGVYKILTKTEVPEPVKELVRPINVGFPQEVFDNLKQRKNYREMDLNESERVILNEGSQLEIETSL